MSRPKPQIILEHVNKANYRSDQVLAADGIYAVFYEGQPITLKTANMLVSYPGPKYKKTSFSNPGHARNLCRKLNTQFKTENFTVVFMNNGTVVYPDEH